VLSPKSLGFVVNIAYILGGLLKATGFLLSSVKLAEQNYCLC